MRLTTKPNQIIQKILEKNKISTQLEYVGFTELDLILDSRGTAILKSYKHLKKYSSELKRIYKRDIGCIINLLITKYKMNLGIVKNKTERICINAIKYNYENLLYVQDYIKSISNKSKARKIYKNMCMMAMYTNKKAIYYVNMDLLKEEDRLDVINV